MTATQTAPITYVSTRGGEKDKSFVDVMLHPTPDDGGLYMPKQWPVLSKTTQENLVGQPFPEVAFEVLSLFVGDAIPSEILRAITQNVFTSKAFHHGAIAPLRQVGPNAWLIEHYYGPTLSYKDVSMQCLAYLMDYALSLKEKKYVIVGASAGDSGAACIQAFKHHKKIHVCMLHPNNKIDEIQRRQMTSVKANNIMNIALQGSMADCQSVSKSLSEGRAPGNFAVTHADSTNWARIAIQTAVYVYTALNLGAALRPVTFAVPVGNFGNLFAAYAAKKIGIDIHRLIAGTNANRTFADFVETGEVRTGRAHDTLSNNLDVSMPSNLERYVYDVLGSDAESVSILENQFINRGSFSLADVHSKIKRDFIARIATDHHIIETMKLCYAETGMMIDPHTAVGLYAAMTVRDDPTIPVIVSGFADASKYPTIVQQALGKKPPVPERLNKLFGYAEYMVTLPRSVKDVQEHIVKHMHAAGKE